MNPIKKLAKQTAVYGISSIVGRFLNYLLVPLYTRFFTPSEYGVISEFYAYSGFLMVLLTFGMETAIFRFAKKENAALVKSTALSFLFFSSLFFVALISLASPYIASMMHYEEVYYFFTFFAFIIGIDAVSSVPFAVLRLEERPSRFAFVKLVEILVNIGLNLLFIYAKFSFERGENSLFSFIYNPQIGVGYIFIANLIASFVKLILLSDIFVQVGMIFNRSLIKEMLMYSLPLVVIGFAGIVNEMLDRSVMKFLLPGTPTDNLATLGIYSACYKISIVMSLFIQAFRFAAEPFFFSIASKSDDRKVYADVMDWFVWFCSLIFLVVTIFKEEFGLFVGEDFREGLFIVPILLLANIMLGMYVNLSIWYKLTDKTKLGAVVAILGAVLTVILLFILVPLFGYEGAAWATLICYSLMAMVSYFLGKKYFPIQYKISIITFYILSCIGFWIVSIYTPQYLSINTYIWKVGLSLLAIFFVSIFKIKPLINVLNTYAKS